MSSTEPAARHRVARLVRGIRPLTWIGLGGTLLMALLGLAAGGVGTMLFMIALVVMITAIYGFVFRRHTWIRLPRKRSAGALGAGIALVVMIGSGAAFGAGDTTSPTPVVAAASTSSPATPSSLPQTPTPTPTPTPVVTTKLVKKASSVPFTSSSVNDAALDKGIKQVTAAGVKGVRTTTFRVVMTDGHETSRTKISQKVTKAPVARVVHIGTYVAPAPAPAPASAPAPAPAAPAVPAGGGATAQCNDGSLSYAAHHQGACSHHGGVAVFYK